MDLPNDPFSEVPNSMWSAMFDQSRRTDTLLPSEDTLDTLSMVSSLYLYTNPPPYGTGTPAPKVAETVLRSLDFNMKTEQEERQVQVGRYQVDNPVWDVPRPFPFHEVSSNFHAPSLAEMAKGFLIDYHKELKRCAQEAIQGAMITNSEVLTKGKQTWCPFTESSVPCPQAYLEACEFLVKNGKPNHHTLLEFIQHFMSVMSSGEVNTKVVKHRMVKSKKRCKNQSLEVSRRLKRQRRVVLEGEQVADHCQDLLRSFCSYIKHGERGHLQRRAIASPNVFLRALFHIIEDLHLSLGKLIQGSTISIGGELKKAKIQQTMDSCVPNQANKFVLQGTQDATKWNECLSASGFGLFSSILFNDEVREELRLEPMSYDEKLMGAICEASHFVLAIKMITLGEGLQGVTEDFRGNITYEEQNLAKFNQTTSEWVERILPLRYGNNYITASGGMLMGMHNALSTTYGLLSLHHHYPLLSSIYTLRSSDDSMTVYAATNLEALSGVIATERAALKLLGINLSPKKTLYFPGGYGEYTSWYQDSALVSQFGTETTKLRPGGHNPPDDFYTIAKATAVSQMNLESNPIGSEARIRLGIDNVRSLYRIKRRRTSPASEEEVISPKVRVMADGGDSPWNATNCHLEETSLKRRLIRNESERCYLIKVCDPENPFSGEAREDLTWSKEAGTLTLDLVDTPRTVFHYVKRANASIKNTKGKTHADDEKHNAIALEILTNADLSLTLKVPAFSGSMAKHVMGCMETEAMDLDFTEEEKALLMAARGRLRERVHEEEDDENWEEEGLRMEDA
uniref:RNA-directed RNA polymerase catalytic subunit n=1 Tax=Wuhan Mosquito Virus 3 TaxID=1608128 RepID=A0A0B5KRD5_9ORTO|nr:PB1 [Wuhan Mosquito Virus 3]